MPDKTSDKKEQRNFGLLMAAAISLIGVFRWWHRGVLPIGFFIVAAVFAFLGIVFPRALKPVLVVWLGFAERLNQLVTYVLLTLVFFVLIVPTRLVFGVLGHDPLKRHWDPDASTYWEDAEEQPSDLERYRNQF